MESAVGPVVSISMFRELGPVLTGLMVAGRVGASIARPGDRHDESHRATRCPARALGVQPVDYLVVPRALAIIVSMPLLVAESVGLGIVAGYLVGTRIIGISAAYYVSNTIRYTTSRDIKIWRSREGFVFGLLIIFISCREGLNAKEGAVGVGRAPTEAVVNCSLFILVVNFFLSIALNYVFPYNP